MFYLAFPLVARLLRKQRLLAGLLLLFVFAGPFARVKAFNPNPVWREYSYLGGMDGIALGCLTAMLLRKLTLSKAAVRTAGVIGTILILFTLCFSIQEDKWGLGKSGFNFTILAVGVSLATSAASQSPWRAPKVFAPILVLGQRSYEIYLTHMFAVVALFSAFIHSHASLKAVPSLFVGSTILAGGLGWFVAIIYAEPMNLGLRKSLRLDAQNVGAAKPLVE